MSRQHTYRVHLEDQRMRSSAPQKLGSTRRIGERGYRKSQDFPIGELVQVLEIGMIVDSLVNDFAKIKRA